MMIKMELILIIGKEILDAYFDLKKQRIHGEAASTDSSNQN